ncbi:MAG: serine/threonine protein kinase [Polyangiaceae bacterium]|nr:serine/threonine protein kinase [Polyangiaceae bacterium]
MTLLDAELASRDLEELRRGLRTMGLVGGVAWPAFLLLDFFMLRYEHAGASLGPILLWRVIGEACILGGAWALRSAGASSGRLYLAEISMIGGAALCVSLMARSFGGIGSSYMHGVGTVLLFRAAFVPSRLARSLRTLPAMLLIFPAVTLPGRASPSPSELSHFVANYVFVLAIAVIGAIGSNAVWSLHRQVFAARRLGRYRLKRQIGRGGMGDVWLAWDNQLRRDVALKVISEARRARRKDIERFEREALATSRLASPHTVAVHDFGVSDDGVCFLAMEYLDGCDLAELVRRGGPLAPELVLQVGLQACASLEEAHAAGIVHRDIKPENLFLVRTREPTPLVKVLDFGIARLADEQPTQTGTLLGTPLFTAPERWLGQPADERSDVYSLGATLYYLLTGVPPRGSAGENVGASLDVPAVPPSALRPDTPAALEAAVLRATAPDPRNRFASAGELARALAEAAQELSAHSPTGSAEAGASALDASTEGGGRTLTLR